ncbi:hypothetical protein R1flu_003588 [Riccia fluitans]|uniref:Uncharacterized protein n=1 Tax=Riccia fluitans TaxID=41844 RepID=A0ABD1Y9E8_9MARC
MMRKAGMQESGGCLHLAMVTLLNTDVEDKYSKDDALMTLRISLNLTRREEITGVKQAYLNHQTSNMDQFWENLLGTSQRPWKKRVPQWEASVSSEIVIVSDSAELRRKR